MKFLTDLLWTLVRWILPLSAAAVVVAVALGSNRIGEEVLTAQQLAKRLNELEAKMFKHAQNLEFEQAAACRDAIAKLKQEALLR